MKKLALYVMFMLLSIPIFSIELGEYMVVDGIPSIVIYVDQTGQHGMVMSAVAFSEKPYKYASDRKWISKCLSSKNWNDWKKVNPENSIDRESFEGIYLEMPAFDYKKFHKIAEKTDYNGLRGLTSEYGKENAVIIAKYCEENDIDMEEYCPDQVWASQLGDGWYIPGNAELELYAQFLGQEIGKGYKKNVFEMDEKEIWYGGYRRYNLGYAASIGLGNAVLFAPLSIRSSTTIISDWTRQEENASKFHDINVKKLDKRKKDNFYYFGLWQQGGVVINYWLAFGPLKKIKTYVVAVKEI
ncbi:MAG: hypothetical protein U0K53_00225 [Paludibacteraceae bacterium]|nr:hypothetical protein [Paludibacteraceae bacterium]